jgi:hypothetical protein
MTDDELRRLEAKHEAERQSTVPASKGYVTRSVDALAAATAQAIKAEVVKLRRSADTTEALLQDLDERLAAIEARLLELEK